MDKLGTKLFMTAAAVIAAATGAIVMLKFCVKIVLSYLYFLG